MRLPALSLPPRVRRALDWARQHAPPPRRVARWSLVATALGTFALVTEAAIRARLGSPESRVPTVLLTRADPWGSQARSARPLEVGPLAADLREYRLPVHLDDVPERVVHALLAVEDQRFYDHHGLDLKRIAGAAVANIKAAGITQGGSTITQQLAKNLYLSPRRTPLRKMREAAMALVLEDRYDKDTILEAWLNEIYLGQDGPRAIHGIGAAARHYFGKDVDDVTLGEAAMLAGMIRAPNAYSPVRNPETARQRRDLVLRLMVEQERVSERAAERAGRERIRNRPAAAPRLDARYFRDFAATRLADAAGGLPKRGVTVHTTLDAWLQRAAERAVREGLADRQLRDAQAALVALDPHTGEVLAMVGGRDYGASQFNRAVEARRQPGSAFKPVVALTALGRESGSDGPAFTLASVVPDEPFRIATPAGGWEPQNYDRGYRGEVTLREALEQSLNIPFARIGLEVGPERIVSTARRLGVTSPLRAVPSLALGTSEVTPLELTRAFGVLAAGGYRADLRTLMSLTASDGNPHELEGSRGDQAVPADEAYLVTSALEGVVAQGTGRGLSSLARRGGVAGKSGTSDDWRDAWFVAYTPSLVVGVWVGHDDGRSLERTGSSVALPIAGMFLREAFGVQEPEPFPVPDGVEFVRTGDRSFGWYGWHCEGQIEVFLEGTAPEDRCRSFGLPRSWRRAVEVRIGELSELLGEGAEDVVAALMDRLAEAERRARRR